MVWTGKPDEGCWTLSSDGSAWNLFRGDLSYGALIFKGEPTIVLQDDCMVPIYSTEGYSVVLRLMAGDEASDPITMEAFCQRRRVAADLLSIFCNFSAASLNADCNSSNELF